MGNNVSQDQFNSHLTLIHSSIKDSNERTDQNFNKLLTQMATISRESSETRMEILMLTKEHTTRLDVHAGKLNKLETDVEQLKEHKTKTTVYWFLFGTVLIAILGGLVKLIFG